MLFTKTSKNVLETSKLQQAQNGNRKIDDLLILKVKNSPCNIDTNFYPDLLDSSQEGHDFKHNVFDWSDEKEPTVVQFGELIESVADNFAQIAEMIREACAELEKEQVEIIHHDETQTNVERRKFKVQLMMDGMCYMATLNQVSSKVEFN